MNRRQTYFAAQRNRGTRHIPLHEVTARGLLDRRFSPGAKKTRGLKGSGTGGEELTEYEILIGDTTALSKESDKLSQSQKMQKQMLMLIEGTHWRLGKRLRRP